MQAEASGEVLGGLVVGPTLVVRDQSLQAHEVLGAEALSLEVGPVVVEAGKEFTPVQIDGLLERSRLRRITSDRLFGGGGDVAVELGDIEPIVRGNKCDVEESCLNEGLTDPDILQRCLDLPSRLAEPAPGPLLGEVRPKRARDQIPGVATSPIRDQVCE